MRRRKAKVCRMFTALGMIFESKRRETGNKPLKHMYSSLRKLQRNQIIPGTKENSTEMVRQENIEQGSKTSEKKKKPNYKKVYVKQQL